MARPTPGPNGVAVITGGASGFGRALAELLAERGFDAVLLDRDGGRAEREAAALSEAHGVDALGVHVDVTKQADVDAAAAEVAERYGRADVVVSNVGVQLFGAVDRLTEEEWRWVLDVNVIGAARTAHGFIPLLRRSQRPRLAFTASSSVLAPASRMATYQASKFALWGLAETLRLELAGDDIAVSVIFPAGMISRHLETSTAAQPHHLRRPIAAEGDLEAMHASNPHLAHDVATPENAARAAIDALLAGERYIVTHGDVVDAVETRGAELRRAAELGRSRPDESDGCG